MTTGDWIYHSFVLLFDFVKGIAWPAVVGVVAFGFREQIREAIKRAKKLSAGGATVELDQLPSQEVPRPLQPGDANLAASLHMGPDEPLLRSMDQEVRAAMIEQFPNPVDREQALVRFFSMLALYLNWEVTYRTIFGSQLELLLLTNSEPANLGTAKTLYNNAKEEYPDAYRDLSFEKWLSFLTDAQLVSQTGERLLITENFGRSFARYVVMIGLPLKKPF